jgi:hypothetical protein
MEIPMWIKFVIPLVSMAIVFVAIPGNVSAAGSVVNVSTLELPVMILTPTDLGFGGMAAFPIDHVEGVWQTQEETVEEYVYRYGISEQRANDVFAKTGLLQRYRHEYVLRYPNDPVPQPLSLRRVTSSVFEFADDSAATTAFDPLARLLAWDAPAINAGIVPIGDNSRLSRAEIPYENIEGTYPELRLTFRTGHLIASVAISDDMGEPDLAAVETLANQLMEYMVRVTTEGGPGLSRKVLRYEDDNALRGNYDGYNLINGTPIVRSSGSSDALKTVQATAAAGAGALDGYKLSYYLVADYGAWVADYGNMIYRFPDQAAAAAWLDVLPNQLDMRLAPNLKVEETKVAGHKSFIATYEAEPDSDDQKRQISAIQVGSFVAIVYGPELNPETTEELLSLEVEILSETALIAV